MVKPAEQLPQELLEVHEEEPTIEFVELPETAAEEIEAAEGAVDTIVHFGQQTATKISERIGVPVDEETQQKLEAIEDESAVAALEVIEDNEAEKKEKKPLKEKAKELLTQLGEKMAALEQFLGVGKAIEQIKTKLAEVLGTMAKVSETIDPVDPQNEDYYRDLTMKFKKMVLLKRGANAEVSKAFSDMFHEYSDFIEEDFIMPFMEQQEASGEMTMSEESLTQKIYSRSPEEVEAIKMKNRENVVGKLTELSQEKQISLEMIEELHATNNKGIVPKKYSRMREKGDMIATFGRRIGVLSEDVKTEMQAVVDRANQLLERREQGMNRLSYQAAIAKLHNDMLDIHPFGDRNGSTSLLFMELMAMKSGYEPQPNREKDYYKLVKNVLGRNYVGIGLVAYEHYKISKLYGHYKGETLDKEKKARYKEMVKEHKEEEKPILKERKKIKSELKKMDKAQAKRQKAEKQKKKKTLV